MQQSANHIRSLVLPEGEIIDTGTGALRSLDHTDAGQPILSFSDSKLTFKACLSITQTCRQVRKDTLKRLYRSNTFLIQGRVHRAPNTIAHAKRWMKDRPQDTRNTSVSFVLLQYYYVSGKQRKLAEVDIVAKTVRQWNSESCRIEDKQSYKDCFKDESSVEEQLVAVMTQFFYST